MNVQKRIGEVMLGMTSGMNDKEKLKFYIELTKETMKSSTDLILLERSEKQLKNLENTLIEVLTKEYYLVEIDKNN